MKKTKNIKKRNLRNTKNMKNPKNIKNPKNLKNSKNIKMVLIEEYLPLVVDGLVWIR